MLTDTTVPAEVRPTTRRPPGTRLWAVVPGLAIVASGVIQLDGAVITSAYRSSSPVSEDRFSFPWDGATAVATSLMWGIAQVLLLVGLVAFARGPAVATRSGRVGAWMAVAGTGAFVLAHAVSIAARDAETDETGAMVAMALFGVGTLLLAVGLFLAGWCTWRSSSWSGWRRCTPLAIAVCMVVLIPLQFTPALAASIGVFALVTMVFGTALLLESVDLELGIGGSMR